jgi:hypothetical protein
MPKKPSISISSPNDETTVAAGPLSIVGTVTAADVPVHSLQVQFDEDPPVSTSPGPAGNFTVPVHYPDDHKKHKVTVTANPDTEDSVRMIVQIGPVGCSHCVKVEAA